jgi:hypothetical protein
MRRSLVPPALLLPIGLVLLVALPALAQSSAPSPAEPPPTADPNTEVWQDEPLPPDVPEGRTIDVGFTVWDVARQTLSQVNSADIRVYPKTGKAKPTEGHTHSDWSGHVIAPLTVPKGGMGRIEIGFPAQVCHDDGTCEPLFMPFTFGGVGPPPQAPRSLLVDAKIHQLAAQPAVGEPIDVDVDITPRAEWDPTALALPSTVVLIASQLGGQSTTQVDMRLVNDGHYTASITLDQPGDTLLSIAFSDAKGALDPIDRSALRLRVRADAAAATPGPTRAPVGTAPTPASGGPDLPFVPIAIGAVALLGGAFVIRRALADL